MSTPAMIAQTECTEPSSALVEAAELSSALVKAAEPSSALTKAAEPSISPIKAAEPSQDDDTEDTWVIKELGDAEIDIVFVPGLIGKKAWTSSTGVFWPGSLFASKVPEARIISFEYSQKIHPFFEDGTRISTISDQLLLDLKGLRKGTQTRPIIFVAHCLGGVILEAAIVRASKSKDQREKGLVPCIRGILLLGTPHFKEESEQDAKKYFEHVLPSGARIPEDLAFNKQLQSLKLVYKSFIELQKTGQTKFEIESFCAGKGNAVSEELAQSETFQSRFLNRDQLQLSQYDNEKNRDFKQVVQTLTSWSETVQESKPGATGSEYVAHVTFAGSKSTGMQVGQNTSSISGLSFTSGNLS